MTHRWNYSAKWDFNTIGIIFNTDEIGGCGMQA